MCAIVRLWLKIFFHYISPLCSFINYALFSYISLNNHATTREMSAFAFVHYCNYT